MANTKVTQHVIANNAIQEAMITNAAVTPDKLHGTLDLSSKSITLPSAAVATTQSASDNSTKLATTAYVTTAVSNLVDSAPSSLDTLNELAAALNDDASFSTTVTTSIASKLPLAGGTMTGNIAHAGDFTLDVGGDIILDADTDGRVFFFDGGTEYGNVGKSSNNLILKSAISDGDILFQGNDGGSTITALTLDMSAAGFATFNDGGSFGGTGALKVPVGTTAQRPSAATGQIRWNSTDGALEVYNGSSWTAVGTSGSNKVLDTFTGDGSTTAFTLSVTPANEDALMVFIDGVYQEKGDYSLSNAVITLDTAPASGEKIAVHTTTASVHDGTSALTQQFTGDGSTTAFTLSQDPNGENNTQVFVNGVYQPKTTYSVSGTTLTFASAPANSAVIEVIMFTVTTLGNTDTVTEGVSNLYHTSARAISAISAGNLTGLTVDTNVLKVDATNNRVGIGTTSPNSELDVFASSTPAVRVADSSGFNVRLEAFGSNTAGLVCAGSSTNMTFQTNETERMRLDTSGNLLLGATSTNFGAFSNSTSPQLLVAGTMPQVALHETDTDKDGYIGIAGSTMFIQTADAIPIRFGTSDVERLRIDSSGNIGFNTSDATVGSTNSSQASTATPKRIVFNNDYSNGYTDASLKMYLFNSGNTRQGFTSGPAYDLQYHSSGSASGRHAFYVANTEIARITADGVGIGETSPAKLGLTGSSVGKVLHMGGDDCQVRLSNSIVHHDNSGNTQLTIRNNYGATSASATMRLEAGSIYFSTGTSFTERLRINHLGRQVYNASATANAHGNFVGEVGSGYKALAFERTVGGGEVGSIVANTGSTSYYTTSDYRLKENVNYTWDATERLKQLKPARFNYIADDSNTLVDGFLAHEVSSIVPEAILGEKDAVDGDGNPEYQGIDQSKLVPLLVKTIQELEARITALESE